VTRQSDTDAARQIGTTPAHRFAAFHHTSLKKSASPAFFCDSSGNRLWPAALEGAHEGGFNREIAAMATVTVAFRQQFTRVSACMNITEPVDNRHDVA
jgi:hypothetical protein